MLPETYTYGVNITASAAVLRAGALAVVIPGAGVVNLKSKPYTDLKECEADLSTLMSALGTAESQLSARPHVIVTKVNPLIDADSKDSPKDWDKLTVLRAYIADAKELKEHTRLKYAVTGRINVDREIVGVRR